MTGSFYEKRSTPQTETFVETYMPVFRLTSLLGAFLLFQVELIIGKHILPWFGGTSSVWITCMLFF